MISSLSVLGFAHRVALEVDFVGVVHEAIEDGIGDSTVTEIGVPLIERQLAGDERGCAVVTVVQDR